MMSRITWSVLILVGVLTSHGAFAAEAITPAMPHSDLSTVEGLDRDLTVDVRLAEDFAREALKEPADRPIIRQELIVRTFEGRPQLFWMVKLAGSWKVAYIHANGD